MAQWSQHGLMVTKTWVLFSTWVQYVKLIPHFPAVIWVELILLKEAWNPTHSQSGEYESAKYMPPCVFHVETTECSNRTSCSQGCRVSGAAEICFCHPGYHLNTDGVTCDGRSILENTWNKLVTKVVFVCFSVCCLSPHSAVFQLYEGSK